MAILTENLALALVTLFVYGCQLGGDKKQAAVKSDMATSKSIKNTSTEGFEAFFKHYGADSIFQTSRTIMPLKYTITGDEGESDTTKYIPQNKIGFTRVFTSSEEKKIVTQKLIGPDKVNVRYQVADTGIEINYLFQLNAGKWYLISMTDNSD